MCHLKRRVLKAIENYRSNWFENEDSQEKTKMRIKSKNGSQSPNNEWHGIKIDNFWIGIWFDKSDEYSIIDCGNEIDWQRTFGSIEFDHHDRHMT